ncbi:sigma 54 modulation/S30EA ribosomal C-terminal domain-containing protein [Lentzea sp. NPDC059081]|uniref:sigma 54 modulation/S30EA ribosomal C-terminal domain-containing protein n=1 Tax=Lentzea sp. NPDC059081 TaxID=3346719 RepID=UPI0036C0ABE3
MSRQVASPEDIAITTTGEVAEDEQELVRRQVASVIHRLAGRCSAARVRLTAATSPAAAWPAVAQVNAEAGGRDVRAQVGAAFLREAGSQVSARLGEQVARLAEPWRPRRWPEPGRRGRLWTSARHPEVVRRKEVRPARCSPDDAALTMDLLDFDVHLFVDAGSGQDSVVYRVGPTGYRLARVVSPGPPATPPRLPLTFQPHPTPALSLEQAVHRLTDTEYPFLFYRDATTGRGTVLYHRHDGNYGLLAPR